MLKVGQDRMAIPTLQQEWRERAVLIKNHAGDWGILVGVWVDPDRYRRPGQCTNISLIIYFKMLCIYPLTIIV